MGDMNADPSSLIEFLRNKLCEADIEIERLRIALESIVHCGSGVNPVARSREMLVFLARQALEEASDAS